MNNKNKLKCLDHNIFGQGILIEKGTNQERILCSQCVDIKTSINIQQQNEQKINHHINIQRQRYKEYKQFRKDSYIKKQKIAQYINLDYQNLPKVKEVKQKQIEDKTNPQNLEFQQSLELNKQESQLSKCESFILINIQRFLQNTFYDSFISYRIKWKQKQNIHYKPQALLGQYFRIFSYQTVNKILLNDGHCNYFLSLDIIFNNAIIMDGYFEGGKLIEGMLFTNTRGKIQFNYNLKSLQFNHIEGVPFQLPFTENQLLVHLEYDQEIKNIQ